MYQLIKMRLERTSRFEPLPKSFSNRLVTTLHNNDIGTMRSLLEYMLQPYYLEQVGNKMYKEIIRWARLEEHLISLEEYKRWFPDPKPPKLPKEKKPKLVFEFTKTRVTHKAVSTFKHTVSVDALKRSLGDPTQLKVGDVLTFPNIDRMKIMSTEVARGFVVRKYNISCYKNGRVVWLGLNNFHCGIGEEPVEGVTGLLQNASSDYDRINLLQNKTFIVCRMVNRILPMFDIDGKPYLAPDPDTGKLVHYGRVILRPYLDEIKF